MGLFVIGVLVGWLAEWLFFTFWVKGNTTSNSSDSSDVLAQLRSKNEEIATLQTELDNAKKSVASKSVIKDSIKRKAKTSTSRNVSTSNTEGKKASNATATTASSTTAKKSAAKASTTKSVSQKTTIKKAPVKKASTMKAAPKKATTISKKSKSGDDLTKLSGIGPSMAATLGELGITSYKKLADMDDDILRDMLEESGARLNNNKEAMDSWNEQAELARKGDFAGLKKLQDALKH